MALQLRRAKTTKRLLSDGSTGLAKHCPSIFFGSLNRISLHLVSSSYPIVLTRQGHMVHGIGSASGVHITVYVVFYGRL